MRILTDSILCTNHLQKENFYQKQQLQSKKALPARFLSVAKNSALCVVLSSSSGKKMGEVNRTSEEVKN